MALKNYGVLKGRVIGKVLGLGRNPHFQIHVIDENTDYRLAVNVKSKLAPSELEYLVEPQFQHPFLDALDELDLGWHPLQSKPGGPALDFIRSNLFDPSKMVPLPFNLPGPDNDLNEKLDQYIQQALADEDALIYAFGERWGPENKKDKVFGFLPGNGVHDIHMNQGNSANFVRDDGVYQDGAMLLQFPGRASGQDQWVGLFLKFQSQSWHTDDKTGHQLSTPPSNGGQSTNPNVPPTPQAPDGAVRIVAALVNPVESPEVETVTLLNVTDSPIDLTGWKLLDRHKHSMSLQGGISAGETLRITLVPPAVLPNKGGLITLLNPDGLRVDGVTYTKAQASRQGFSLKF